MAICDWLRSSPIEDRCNLATQHSVMKVAPPDDQKTKLYVILRESSQSECVLEEPQNQIGLTFLTTNTYVEITLTKASNIKTC